MSLMVEQAVKWTRCPVCLRWGCAGHVRVEVEQRAEQVLVVAQYLREEGHAVDADTYYAIWRAIVLGLASGVWPHA